MDESSSYLIIILSVLSFDVIMTLGYAALQNSRPSDLQEQADTGHRHAKRALALLDTQSKLYITHTIISAISIAVIVLTLAFWLIVPILNGTLDFSLVLAIGIVFLASLIALILGTVVPEAIGSAYTKSLTSILTPFLHVVTVLFSPITVILLAISSLLARLFGSDTLINTITEEEIMTMVNAGNTDGTIEDEEKDMIFSILQLDQTYAREIMVPRIDIEAIEAGTSLQDALDAFIRTGFSRIPAYEEHIDNIIGLLYAKDLLNLWHNGGLEGHYVKSLVRTAYFVPETRAASDLLRDLQARNVHMAIVVDEYGGTSGLVTIENIIEEIVGDIRDEYDLHEEQEYIRHHDDEYLIDAGMDLDDMNELLGTTLDSVDSDTLGGYIFLQIGRVPIVGETIESNELQLTVNSIEGRRIRKVLVTVKPKADATQALPDNQTQLADVS